MTTILKSVTPFRIVAVLALVISSLAPSTKAWAITSPEVNTVSIVQWQAAGALVVQDGSGNYFYAELAPGSGCSSYAVSMDTIKLWVSQLQAALLSGKTVRFYFSVCSGANYITILDLNQ
jgi:hypothetical protein